MGKSEAPLLVIGMGRGGTSLLTACLDGHHRISMKSEFHTTRILLGDNFAISSIENLLDDRLRAFRKICDEDALYSPGKIWGNKITTEQLYGLEEYNILNNTHIDVLERFIATMHGYRIVFIIRHGASCIDSKVRRTGQPIMRAAIRWCYGIQVFEHLLQLGAISFWCKYEDLISIPKETLSRLCGALGLDFDESMLCQTTSELILPEYRHGRFLSEKAKNIPELPQEISSFIQPWLNKVAY